MARPNWEYVRVDVLLPDNPKLDGLSAAAKWTLLELWCYCGQHLTDGFVRDAKWRQFGTATIRARLLERALAERVPGGYQMHDYLDHQRSRAEVMDLKEKRAEAGRRSAEARAKARADAATRVEQVAEQNGSKTATEAEAEAEAEVLLVAEVDDQSPHRNAQVTTEIDLIISEISQVTGQTIDEEWAGRVRDGILGTRAVSDRCAYLQQAIRGERNPRMRFLPAPTPPPVADVLAATGGRRVASEDVAGLLASTRRAITKPTPESP